MKVFRFINFYIILWFILSFVLGNCMDFLSYDETKPKPKSNRSTLLTYGLVLQSTNASTQTVEEGVTLDIVHGSAAGANDFLAYMYDSSGKRVAGISSKLKSDKTYTGFFKATDTSGSLTSSNASIGPGSYVYGVYVDSDGSGTVNYAGDKVFWNTVAVEENGRLSNLRVEDASFTSPKDIMITYNHGDVTAQNGKTVICYFFMKGVGSSLTTASTLSSTRNTHGVAVAAGTVSSGNFEARISNLLTSVGSSWSSHTYRFLPSDVVGDVVCHIDSTVNFTPDTGEFYFQALSQSTTNSSISITTHPPGTLQ